MRASLRLIKWALSGKARAFQRALAQPAEAQRQCLERITQRMRQTDYAKHHNWRSIDDFDRLPLTDYDGLKDWLTEQRQTERRVLCPDPVLFYEKTSGSSGPEKLIPYTRPLKASFSEMFALWAHDLLSHGPRFRGGQLFFSISPQLQSPQSTAQGKAIGLDSDAEYLDGCLRLLFQRYLLDTRDLKSLTEPEVFKNALCERLRQSPRLEIMSVWNPSFLSILLAHLRSMGETRSWQELWPELKLISCWTSAGAQKHAAKLRAECPHVLIQGKGLLATEAAITVPLVKLPVANTGLPLLRDVFLEFIDPGGQLRRLHELDLGHDYELVLTQIGGLCRYRLGDRVRVHPGLLNTPALEFIGREAGSSDLVGEKLNEAFVTDALTALVNAHWPGRLWSLAAKAKAEPGHYVLLIEAPDAPEGLAEEAEQRLCEAYHYRQARLLGQLGPLAVEASENLSDELSRAWMAIGRVWGDRKDRALLDIRHAEALFE